MKLYRFFYQAGTMLVLVALATVQANAQKTCPLQLSGPGAGNLSGAYGGCAPCGVEVTYQIIDLQNCFPSESCNGANAFEVQGGYLVSANSQQITVVWDCNATVGHAIVHSRPCEPEIYIEEAIQICETGAPPTGCCSWDDYCPGINCAIDNLEGNCKVLCGEVVTYTIQNQPPPAFDCAFTRWTVTGGTILWSNQQSVTVQWSCADACQTGEIVADLFSDPAYQTMCIEAWVEAQICIAECRPRVKGRGDQFNEETSFNISPNPVSDQLRINLPENSTQLLILNALGQIIHSENRLSTTQHTIEVSHWANGVYYVCASGQGFSKQMKMVKSN